MVFIQQYLSNRMYLLAWKQFVSLKIVLKKWLDVTSHDDTVNLTIQFSDGGLPSNTWS